MAITTNRNFEDELYLQYLILITSTFHDRHKFKQEQTLQKRVTRVINFQIFYIEKCQIQTQTCF